MILNAVTSDIRDTACEVNDRLKKLILPEDDADIATDEEDKISDMIAAFHIPKPTKTGSSGNTSPYHQGPAPSTNSSDTKTGTSSGGKSRSDQKDAAQPASTATQAASTSTSAVGTTNGGTEDGLALLDEKPKLHLLSVLAVLIPHMKFTHQETRKETLRWLMWLHQQLPRRVSVCGR